MEEEEGSYNFSSDLSSDNNDQGSDFNIVIFFNSGILDCISDLPINVAP